METNVAMQHVAEKWAAGEALYEQPEKVTYIYGCQKRGRENRSVARLLVKPSKSYDNELEAAVGRDADVVGSRVRGQKVKDDLSISCRKRPEQSSHGGEGRRGQPRHAVSAHSVPEKYTMRPGYSEGSFYDADSYGGRNRYRSKPKSTESSHKSRHRNLLDFQQIDSRYETAYGQKMSNPHSSKKRPIPVEFHLTEDQLPISGPTVQLKRPANLASPFSPAASLCRDKPSSLVILEIKDGPTFFYKPSDHMLSDVGMGDEMAMSSRGYFSSAQAAAGYPSPDTSGSHSKDPSKTSSTSAYKGSLSFSNSEHFPYSPLRRDSAENIPYSPFRRDSAENTPYSPFRRDSSTGSRNVSPVSIGAAGPSLEETSRFRSSVSHLPRTPGLRKPDLSVLSTTHKSRANSFDDETPLSNVHKDEKHRSSLAKQPASLITSMPISSTYTVLPAIESLPLISHEPPTAKPQPPHSINLNDSKENAVASATDIVPYNKSQDSIVPLPPTEAALDVTHGFQNIYEILQQKAGIKHDDIVVGPRRPQSGIYPDDFKEQPDNSFPVVKFASLGPGSVAKKPKEQAGLSLSTDGLSIGHPPISLKCEDNRRKHTHSESEVCDVEVSAGDSRSKYSSLKSNLNKGTYKDISKSSASKQPHLLIDEQTAEPVLGKVSVTVNDFDTTENWRKDEKRAEVQKCQPGTAIPGYNTELKSKVANLALSSETAAPYTTKSLDRNLKYLAETKHVSKSANTSPAKQQQLHSPKAKSALPTPVKKNPAGSKLHMLSNIPVPICHDPPIKRSTGQRAPSTQVHMDATVPSAFEKDPAAASYKSSSGNLFLKLESAERTPMPSISQVSSALAAPTLPAERVDRCKEEKTVASLPCSEHVKTPGPALNSRLTTVLTHGSENQLDNSREREDLSSSKVAASSEANTSAAVTGTVQQPAPSSLNAPSHAPVKPRLHRSAEHLLGDAKLAVFNSAENVPHFEHIESSSTRAFQDSPKSETAEADSISPLKKNHSLAKIGIMRRGSDRTETYRRGSDRAILPINQNDPSVEDLKKATSLKELCQSMASLLNIDNVKAAEMITTSLSQRQDLVEGLDADAILDYLSHHGVLDPGILVGLDDKSSTTQRNSAILRHVEEHGNTAVALFINALRQSGQLHLASSLDTEQRIQPVSGSGYFGKDRHKGELTIKIEIESLKIIAPREPRSEKIVDTSLLGTPGRQSLDDSGVVVKDAADEEDFVKPRSCWCFCFSYKSKTKSMSKKDTEKQKKNETHKRDRRNQSSSPEKSLKPVEEPNKEAKTKPHRTKSQEKIKKVKDNPTKVAITESSKKDLAKSKDKDNSKKSKASKSKSKISGKHSVTNSADASLPSADQTQSVKYVPGDHGAPKMTLGLSSCILQQSQTTQYRHFVGVGDPSVTAQCPKLDKESWDPIIMEYDPKLELIKLRAGQEELASPTRQSGNTGIMCEQWKSTGRHFQQKASLLCERIVQVVQTEIIKYFEQDRGTLVLDVVSGISSILIINICMKRAQVKRLQQEIADKSLLSKMEDMFFSRVNITDFDIRGVSLRIVLDEQELNTVLSELS